MRDSTYSQAKERALREVIQRALAKHAGNRTHAARELGLDRAYLQRLVKKYGLKGSC